MTSWLVTVAALAIALVLLVRWIEPRVAFFPFQGETETPRNHGLVYEALTLTTSDGERLAAWMMALPSSWARAGAKPEAISTRARVFITVPSSG